MVKFLDKCTSIEPNVIETQQFANLTTVIIGEFAIVMMGSGEKCSSLWKRKDLVYSVSTGNRIHSRGIITFGLG